MQQLQHRPSRAGQLCQSVLSLRLKHSAELHHHSMFTERFSVISCLTDRHSLMHRPTDLSRGQEVIWPTNIIRVKCVLFKFSYELRHKEFVWIWIKTLNGQFRVILTEWIAYCVWSRGHVLMLFPALRGVGGNEVGWLPLSQIGRNIK